jgi:hypothetical protein
MIPNIDKIIVKIIIIVIKLFANLKAASLFFCPIYLLNIGIKTVNIVDPSVISKNKNGILDAAIIISLSELIPYNEAIKELLTSPDILEKNIKTIIKKIVSYVLFGLFLGILTLQKTLMKYKINLILTPMT